MNKENQYAIEIRGKVQMVGFRNFIEANALNLGLGGIVFNDVNGSVKILCQGKEEKIKTLIRLIEVASSDIGAEIESIKKEEIPVKIPLPPFFFKEPTVELKDIKSRLDEGVEVLKSMDKKLGKLDDMDKKLDRLESMDKKLDGIDKKLGKLDDMDKKLDRLESMDKKLDGIDKKLGKLDDMDKKLGKLDEIGSTLKDIKDILSKNLKSS